MLCSDVDCFVVVVVVVVVVIVAIDSAFRSHDFTEVSGSFLSEGGKCCISRGCGCGCGCIESI